LLSLDLWHLPKRMFFAGAANDHGRGNDEPGEPKSHIALAQLSASSVMRKVKATGEAVGV